MATKTSSHQLSNPVRKMYDRELSVIGRQRLTLLLYCYLPIMIIGVAANFLGLTQPSAVFFTYTHSLCLVAAAVALVLYYKQVIDVGTCLATFCIIGQCILTVEMIYCAVHPSSYYMMLIMANMVLLALNTMVSMAAYMRDVTMGLGFTTIVTYVLCASMTDDDIMKSFIIVFFIAFGFVSLVGIWVSRSSSEIETENEKMRREEEAVLNLLNMKRSDMMVFVELASKDNAKEVTRYLLQRLDDESRHTLLTNVQEYLVGKKSEFDVLKEVFPEFTLSELEICQLMLQGKKPKEISKILDKTAKYVNEQRSNMRKKFGLTPQERLSKRLKERMAEYKKKEEEERKRKIEEEDEDLVEKLKRLEREKAQKAQEEGEE